MAADGEVEEGDAWGDEDEYLVGDDGELEVSRRNGSEVRSDHVFLSCVLFVLHPIDNVCSSTRVIWLPERTTRERDGTWRTTSHSLRYALSS